MNKKYFIKFLLAGGSLFLILFLFVSTVFLLISGKTHNNVPIISEPAPQPTVKRLILYSISGKIKSIEGNKISMETLTADSITKPLSEKKLEIRKLEIGKDTKINRLNFIPRKKDVKMPENPTADSFGSLSSFAAVITAVSAQELKTGDNIGADYISDLTEIINFTPTTITILPYTAY